MSFKKLLTLFVLTAVIHTGGAWAAVINRGDDFGSFVRLRNRTVDTRTHISVFQPAPASDKGFYILQFNGPVEESWKSRISAQGVRFLSYIPDNAFIVKVPQSSFSAVQSDPNVKWLGEYSPEDKKGKGVNGVLPPAGQTRVKKFVVKVFDDEDMSSIVDSIQLMGGDVEVVSDTKELNGKILNVTIDEATLQDITLIPSVESIDIRPVPVLHNDVAVTTEVMNVTPVWSLPAPLSGKGQVVGIIDTGIDNGDTTTIHPAFRGNAGNGLPKIKYKFTYGRAGVWSDPHGHGTHTSGSIAGKAVTGYNVKGVAYDAQIVIQSAYVNSSNPLGGVPDLNTGAFPDAYGKGVRVHNNSWGDTGPEGEPLPGQYNYDSLMADTFAWSHKDFLAVFSAGNDGADSNPSNGVVDLGSISPPATAKNVLAVGASENYRPSFPFTYGGAWSSDYPVDPISSDPMSNNPNGMVAFSSRGPTDDDRIKPDVVAPGTWVLSDRSSLAPSDNYWSIMNTYFAYDGGTSMSAPLTTGAAAIVRQYYTDSKGVSNPSAALIKATIINGATDMYPGQYGDIAARDVTGWPDNNQGWGRVDLARSVAPDSPSTLDYVDNSTGLATGGQDTYTYPVEYATVPARVTLVWTDPPAAPAASKQLVNDLDLEVIAPNGDVYHGNIQGKNPANFDHLNNVESVDIPASGLTTGTLTVKVSAFNVPDGPQPYALAVRYGNIVPIRQGIDLSYTQNGTSVTVTATMYYNDNPASGKTITFYNKLDSGSFSSKGTATTNTSGIAKKTFTAALGSNTVYAAFAAAGGIPTMSSDNIGYTIAKVILSSPATGAVVTTATPTLSWAPYTDATGYHVQVSTSSTFAAGAFKLNADTADASASIESPPLNRGTTYYWRVQALIPTGKSVYSTANKVVYKSATALSVVSVTQDGLKVKIKAALTGELGAAVGGRKLVFYEGATSKTSGSTAADGTYTGTITSTVGSHTYTVKFNGDTNYAPATAVDVPVVVKKVTLIAPANGAIVPAPQPLLSWSLYSADTSKYHVQVSRSSTFAAGYFKLNADTADASTSVVTPALAKGITYYWRVQALIPPAGKSVYSDKRNLVYK